MGGEESTRRKSDYNDPILQRIALYGNSNFSISVFLVVIGSAFVFHFVALFVYNLPLNASGVTGTLTTKYVEPYFTQQWNLFAPHPGGPSNGAAFRFSYVDPAGRHVTTDWHLASSLFNGVASNPLSRMYLEREIYYGSLAYTILEVEAKMLKLKKSSKTVYYSGSSSTRTLTRLLESTAGDILPVGSRQIDIQIELLQTHQIDINDYFSQKFHVRKAHLRLTWTPVDPTLPTLK